MRRKINIISIVATIILASCQISNNPVLEVKTFNEQNNWGYEVIKNGKCIIHQDCIPVLSGNMPFTNQEDAKKVGLLVLTKIKNKETPTVSAGELRQLGIKGTS